MARGMAEDAGGLTPAKNGSAALCHFGRRTLPIFKCAGYSSCRRKISASSMFWALAATPTTTPSL